MNKKKSTIHVPIREIHREIHELSKRTHAKLFGYMVLIELLESLIFLPLLRQLWLLSIKSTPDNYITNANFSAIFRSPLVILCALFITVCYCFMTLWETSGLILCIEYKYQDQPFNLLKMMALAMRRIRHIFNAKNILLIPCTIVYSIFFNIFTTRDILSRIHVPDSVNTFLRTHIPLTVGIVILLIFLYFFALQLIYLYYYLVIYCMDFKSAVRQMRSDLRGKKRRVQKATVLLILRLGLRVFVIPFLILIAVGAAVILPTSEMVGAAMAVRILFMNLAPLTRKLADIFLKIEILSIFTVLFHRLQQPATVETSTVPLEDGTWNVHHQRPLRFYRRPSFLSAYLFPIISVIGSVGIAASYLTLVISFTTYPESMFLMLNQTQVIAHKGYSSIAPENTMPSFEKAVNTERVNYIELDVRETSDGEIVVIHDGNLKKAANIGLSVYSLTLDELQSYNALYEFANEKEWMDQFIYIPTLREVYEMYGDDINFIVELKTSSLSPDLAEKVVAIMQEYNRTECDLIQSSNYRALRKVKELDETIQTGLIVTLGTGTYYNLPDVDFFSIEHTFLTIGTISSIHEINKKVYAWTVNSGSDLQTVVAMGVDGIITDRPETAYNAIHSYDDDLLALITDNIEQFIPLEEESDIITTPDTEY